MKITVYLGSSFGKDPIYKKAIVELGHWLVKEHHQLVYGGSKDGLMGVLADTVLADGGEAYGIIPLDFKKREKAHLHLTELTLVADMDERKRLLMENGDVFLAFPGGPGTLEEIIQAFSWARIGLHHKPCIFLNINGYYNPLKEFFDQMVATGFLNQSDCDKAIFVNDLQELSAFMVAYRKEK
ncbi:TIGR00730 family Rossman fold protein [Streptococcus sp. UBA4344]|uniref:LOG family protein n=1 Tax=Streptococcus sp. UBA4344 TaxID=1947564 RepID=UPI00257FDD42|nr:TIGR00730 family Rossman fold protein [Streptococcus sp. UBA4344]